MSRDLDFSENLLFMKNTKKLLFIFCVIGWNGTPPQHCIGDT